MALKHMKYFTLFFIIISKSVIATPDLYVALDSIELKAQGVTVKIIRSDSEDRLSSVKLLFNGKSFEVSKNSLAKAWAPDFQCVRFTHSVNLKNQNVTTEYKLYIPYHLHSESGKEPPEGQELNEKELIIHFSSNGISEERFRNGIGCDNN